MDGQGSYKGKCKVLHLGKSNSLHQYMLRIKQLERSLSERDLGALIDNKLHMSQQYALAAKTANSIQDRIQKSRKALLADVGGDSCPLLSTGKTHLECCVQFCSPPCKRDMDILA